MAGNKSETFTIYLLPLCIVYNSANSSRHPLSSIRQPKNVSQNQNLSNRATGGLADSHKLGSTLWVILFTSYTPTEVKFSLNETMASSNNLTHSHSCSILCIGSIQSWERLSPFLLYPCLNYRVGGGFSQFNFTCTLTFVAHKVWFSMNLFHGQLFNT